jgi:hypothetical protein
LQGNEDEGSILEFAFSAPIVRVRGVRIEQGDSVFESSAICRELRKASSSRPCRSSRAIGRPITTGARCEARLNALPQFVTTIDGLDIHFIHVRSKNPNALPVIITHGWPGSIIEQMKVIGPLTDPTAYGGKAEDAFDVVIPSLPGYGFSGKPAATGWDPTASHAPGSC